MRNPLLARTPAEERDVASASATVYGIWTEVLDESVRAGVIEEIAADFWLDVPTGVRRCLRSARPLLGDRSSPGSLTMTRVLVGGAAHAYPTSGVRVADELAWETNELRRVVFRLRKLSERTAMIPRVARWTDVEEEAADLSAAVRQCFAVRKHATLATLRSDGAPRISGMEVQFADGDVFLGSMPGAVKARDLRRDPRFALHSPTVDPPPDDAGAWRGEAKLAGVAREIGDRTSTSAAHRFLLDINEVVLTRVRNDRLEITSWHENRGLVVRTRE